MLIYSRVKPELLLHTIQRYRDIVDDGRVDITPVEEYLQIAYIKMDRKSFRAHKHIEQIRETDRAQEAWVVIRGKVGVRYFDIDEEEIGYVVLVAGDCFATFIGGHEYTCLQDDTVVYEFKTGPYQGPDKDKVFIGEEK